MDFGRDKSKHRPRNDPKLYGGPYPFIQTGEVRSSDHRITDFTQTYSEAGLAQSQLWAKGTLCISVLDANILIRFAIRRPVPRLLAAHAAIRPRTMRPSWPCASHTAPTGRPSTASTWPPAPRATWRATPARTRCGR